MNESVDLEHIKNLTAGFVVDDLSPQEAEEFRLLLLENPELITEVEDLQEVLRQVLDGFTEVEAPAHLLPNILEQAEASVRENIIDPRIQFKQTNKTNKTNKTRLGLLSISPTKIAASIAALFVLILGIDNYRLRHNLGIVTADNQQLRQDINQAQIVKNLLQNSQTRLFSLQGVSSTKPGSGRVIINPEQQKAVMLFQNLPAPPPGYVYMLWTIVASEKISCGKVKPYSWGKTSYELKFTNELYKEFYDPKFSGLLVTLEADPNVSRPMGTVVMQSSQI
ncbi:MAG: anti-sigma factor [Cyanobacteria bacterium P01_A01_bin.84]